MKRIAILIALCPLFIFSQGKTNEKSVSKVTATYCNEDGRKTLNYIPECDSLDVSMKNYKIISFKTEGLNDTKLFTVEQTKNKISSVSKKLFLSSEKGTLFFTHIKAINTETNEEIYLPDYSIKWDTN